MVPTAVMPARVTAAFNPVREKARQSMVDIIAQKWRRFKVDSAGRTFPRKRISLRDPFIDCRCHGNSPFVRNAQVETMIAIHHSRL